MLEQGSRKVDVAFSIREVIYKVALSRAKGTNTGYENTFHFKK